IFHIGSVHWSQCIMNYAARRTCRRTALTPLLECAYTSTSARSFSSVGAAQQKCFGWRIVIVSASIPAVSPTSLGIAGEESRFPIRRVFCVGRNYAEHAREMGHDPDREPPFFFTKPA